MHFQVRQRVLVRWDSVVAYAARVIDVRDELGRHGLVKQTACRVEYEIDGQRLWHDPAEMSILDEDAVVADPEREDSEDDECVEVLSGNESWQLLNLRCCYSFEKLDDPARFASCLHPSRCNYNSLLTCLKVSRPAPSRAAR